MCATNIIEYKTVNITTYNATLVQGQFKGSETRPYKDFLPKFK